MRELVGIAFEKGHETTADPAGKYGTGKVAKVNVHNPA